MNPLDSFTVERLEALEFSLQQAGDHFGWASVSEQLDLVKIALAAKQAKPVAEVYQPANAEICAALGPSIRMINIVLPAGAKLYATPPLNYPEIPEGWVMVPKSPTLAMLTLLGMTGSFDFMQQKYENMLAAAPKP